MYGGKSLVFIIALSLVIKLLAFILVSNHYNVFQDNYVGYLQALGNGKLNVASNVDSRFLPGYPLAILVISSIFSMPLASSGLIISILSSALSVLLLNKIVKNKITVLLFSVFPPVWIFSSIKIATEPLTVLLLLTSLFLFLKKKYFLAGLILGISTGVRLISISLLASFVVTLILSNKNKILPLICGFISTLSLLLIYNLIVFKDIFHQILLYPKIGGASGSSIGILQIIQDLSRSLNWHQYRIFFSGSFYIALLVTAIIILSRNRNKNIIFEISFYWLLFSAIFMLTYGPSPLLEEFGRFLVPCIPAIIIGITAPFKSYA